LSQEDLTVSTLLAVDRSALQKLNYDKFADDFAQKKSQYVMYKFYEYLWIFHKSNSLCIHFAPL